ncbi:hypothetical protein H4218_005261 [Coemansia sp. IMI 209128]|nr:hypothetical protein H4218_005261 [Coemansia sp. IMI 209128]
MNYGSNDIRVEPRSLSSLNYMRDKKMSFYAKLAFENTTLFIAKRPGFSMRNYDSFTFSTLSLDVDECCYIAYAHKDIYEQYSTALIVYCPSHVGREQLWKLKSRSKEIQSLLGYNYIIDEGNKSGLRSIHTQRPINSLESGTPIYSPEIAAYHTPASVFISSPLISSGFAQWTSPKPAAINAGLNTALQNHQGGSTFGKIGSPAVRPIGEMFDPSFGNAIGSPASTSRPANTHRLADNGALEFFFDDDFASGFGRTKPAQSGVGSSRPEPAPRTVNTGQTAAPPPRPAAPPPRPVARPPPAPNNMFAPYDQVGSGGAQYPHAPAGWSFNA